MVDDAVATLGWWLIQLRDFQQEHLTVHLPKIQRDYLRLVLDDGDSPALSIDAVNAFGHQDQVVFLSLVLSPARRRMPRWDADETNNRARSQNRWVNSIRNSGVVSWECAGRAALSLSHSEGVLTVRP